MNRRTNKPTDTARVKRQETRDKRQETRDKRQETRVACPRIKNQQIDSPAYKIAYPLKTNYVEMAIRRKKIKASFPLKADEKSVGLHSQLHCQFNGM